MSFDQRSKAIIDYLMQNYPTSSKDIQTALKLTPRQFTYAFNKANEEVFNLYGEKIVRTKKGNFIIPNSMIVLKDSKNRENQWLSPNERTLITILLIISNNQFDKPLSLIDICDVVGASKNTVLNDIKDINVKLRGYSLEVSYDYTNGYLVKGDEYQIRLLLSNIVAEHSEFILKNTIINELMIERSVKDDIFYFIGRLEALMHISFTDTRREQLIIICYLYLIRAINKNKIYKLPDSFYSVSGTTEFETVSDVFKKYKDNLTYEELLLISVQLLVSNLYDMNLMMDVKKDPQYQQARQIVENFETLGCIEFNDKEMVVEYVYQHWKPAYFRLKYGFHVQNSLLEMINSDYSLLHELVKEAINLVLINEDFKCSELESSLIAVLLGGCIRSESYSLNSKEPLKVVVVCDNGVVISRYLYETLKLLFGNMMFMDCISIRQFENYNKEYDIVFTTRRLKTDKVQYIVNPPFTDKEKQALVQRVKFDHGGGSIPVKIDSLISIIEKNTLILNIGNLKKDLTDYLIKNKPSEKSRDVKQYNLEDVLPLENIISTNDDLDWIQVVNILSGLLISQNKIEKQYSKEIIKQIKDNHPYIMITPGVIVLHAGVNDGVKSVGFALLKNSKIVSVDGYMESKIFLMIATPKTDIHVNALSQLVKRLTKETVDKIINAESTLEIYKIIFEKGDK